MSNPSQLPRILVVDESRMVRAMLIRHIRDLYDFREEADGEAAWQVLVLDHSIELVICSLSLPVLDGDSLLVRVRSSRLARLCQMPMLMIAGDNEEAIERAKSHGASDFISRSTGGAELLARIDSLLKGVSEFLCVRRRETFPRCCRRPLSGRGRAARWESR